MTDASRFIAFLRGAGGLDEHFAEYERGCNLAVEPRAGAERCGTSRGAVGLTHEGLRTRVDATTEGEGSTVLSAANPSIVVVAGPAACCAPGAPRSGAPRMLEAACAR